MRMSAVPLDFALLPDIIDRCNPQEAPAGYRARPIGSLGHVTQNICRYCDFHETCKKPETDMLEFGHRCQAKAVHCEADGLIYRRSDRCGVIFEKIQ